MKIRPELRAPNDDHPVVILYKMTGANRRANDPHLLPPSSAEFGGLYAPSRRD